MKDLSHLKVGDKVVYSQGYLGKKIVKIERLTKTQIILEGFCSKFRRCDGYLVGGDIWSRGHIVEATQEIIDKIKLDEDLKYIKECVEDNFRGLVNVHMKNKDLKALRVLNERLKL